MTRLCLALIVLIGLAGCVDRPTLTNSDPALHKLSTQFAADAALRHPYKVDAPIGGVAQANAYIDYMFHRVQLANLSDKDWTGVEVWINKDYVVYVPQIRVGVDGGKAKTLDFGMFFDGKGAYYSQSADMTNRITHLDIYLDGKMYSVPMHLAD